MARREGERDAAPITPAIKAPRPVERALHIARRKASRATLRPAEQEALAFLQGWLEDKERPYALLYGPRASGRAATAARLVEAQQESGPYEAHLLPIGPELWLERDLVAVLTSRLIKDYAGGPPRLLWENLADESLREGRAAGEPPLLLAIVNVEKAEPLTPWAPLFSTLGPRIKVLATVEGHDESARVWLNRLGFNPAQTFLLALPPQDRAFERARAYLEQAGAPLAAFAPLVTPEHLARWMTLPHAYLGFVADLERVRKRAAIELLGGAEPSALSLALRATLVEASIHVRSDRKNSEAPIGVERIHLEHRSEDYREQSAALLAIAQAIASGEARAEVLAWAVNAARRIKSPDHRGDALVALAEASEGEPSGALAREAVTAYRGAADPALSLLVAVRALPWKEGLSVAREALSRLRSSGRDCGVLADFADHFSRRVAEALWPDAEALPLPARSQVLAALAANLRDPDRVRAAFEHLEASASSYESMAHVRLERLIPLLDRALIKRAVSLAEDLGDFGREAREALIERLAALGEPMDALLAALPEDQRPRAMARALPSLADPAPLRAQLLDKLREADWRERFHLLCDVGPALVTAGALDELLALTEPFPAEARFTALTLLAPHDPARAPEIARWALQLSQRFISRDADRLSQIIPLAPYLSPERAASTLGALLDAMAAERRASALKGDRTDLRRIIPLLKAVGGDQALLDAAREVIQVAAWFP
jgi:hypothetical protein